MLKPFIVFLACVVPCAAFVATPADASRTAGPGFHIVAVSGPTIFSAEHDGKALPDDYTLTVTNSGSEPTQGPITIVDTLPKGIVVSKLDAAAEILAGTAAGTHIPLSCEPVTVTCTDSEALLPGQVIIVIAIVTVEPGTTGPVTSSATVSGGGAAAASANVTTAIGSAAESLAEPYGIAYLGQQATAPDGSRDAQAGDHPFEQTLSFGLNTIDDPHETSGPENFYLAPGGIQGGSAHTRDIVADVPPGFVGDPNVVEKCPQYDVTSDSCPAGSQIGVANLVLGVRRFNIQRAGVSEFPIYNVVPDKSFPAEFVIQADQVPIPLYVEVSPETNYGVRIITPGIPLVGTPQDVSITFFGTPATDPNIYNRLRSSTSGATPVAFLDDPTHCSAEPLNTKVSVDSWEHPGAWDTETRIGNAPLGPNSVPLLETANWASASTTLFPSLEGCELLQFDPSLAVTPETTRADEPAGVNVDLRLPQAPQQFPALVTPALEDTSVALPAGMSISPSAGDGLQACSDAQIALRSAAAGSCPLASQIGTAKVATPLLAQPLAGHVFLGAPHCDPCTNADASDGNMLRVFLEVAGSGVVVKQEGTIYANTSTGQLTTRFANTPQVPVSDIELQFKGGARAALATPQSCGAFTTTSDLTPWSSPITADATASSTFDVDWDGSGGACPGSAPLTPAFSAGTANPNAGQFSPLTLTFAREDREQDLAGIQVHMPPGLLGSLSGIPLCGETQAQLGTCAASSRLGEMTVGAGPGSHPFYEQGSIYLTGPYRGAPFGLSIVVPTVAGPFNLGNVVVRAKINIDPATAALTVTSDPLPQIIDGIPLRLRSANVTIDRPGFIFNPTNCSQQAITATIAGAQGAQANVSAPFAVAGCHGLKFAPSFKVSTAGKTSRADGASLDAKVTYPQSTQGAYANIRQVKVELPKRLPSRLTTLQKACTAAQFEANPAGCPTASAVGIARATTPLLPVTLVGPAYFVSHGGEAFPSLEIVLQGYGVRVDLVGATFISKAGITSSTFKTVPDVPVDTFELYLPEGKSSALAANGNLCKSKLVMPTSFVAQNGTEIHETTKVAVTGCPRATAARRARQARRARAARRAPARHSGQGRSKS